MKVFLLALGISGAIWALLFFGLTENGAYLFAGLLSMAVAAAILVDTFLTRRPKQ